MHTLTKSLVLAGVGAFAISAQAEDCSNLNNWTAPTIYNTGDKVQTATRAYQANYWTQGNNPVNHSGQWAHWTDLGSCTTTGNSIPTADANGPYTSTLGNPIALSSSGSNDSDGTITAYSWDFGDGNTTNTQNPNHTYTSIGGYTVTLTVTDNDGATASSTAVATVTDGSSSCTGTSYVAGTSYSIGQSVSNNSEEFICDVAGWCSSAAAWAYEPGVGAHWQSAWTKVGSCTTGNLAPTANANGPYTATLGNAIVFSSVGSTDSDGSIASYSWSFGDSNSTNSQNPSHTYSAVGSYTVTLTVTDNDGATTSSTAVATVTNNSGNLAPTAEANGPYTVTLGNALALSSSGSNDSDGTITSYFWDLGDGNTSTTQDPSHSYSAIGNYTITLTVTDNDGATATSTATATVSDNTPPPTGDKKVIGYFPEWGVYGRNFHIKNLVTSGSAERLTHIVYAFGNVQNGVCTMGDSYAAIDKFYSAADSVDGTTDTWDAGDLRGNFNQIRKLKALHPNIKVVWSFGGWTWSGGFGQAAQNSAAFAESCYNLVNDPRWSDVFDGIDIDWEYPNSCGLSCDSSGPAAYTTLMQALRTRFGSQLVTAAIGAGSAKLNAADYGPAAQYLDFYMLMTYDFFGAWDATGPTAPHAALNSYAGIPADRPDFYSSNAVNLLKSFGVPSEKILLGIGFYGRGWTGVTQGSVGGTASGAAQGTYEAGIEDYKVLKNSCPATGTVGGTAIAHCGTNWWSYDTPATIQGKMNYANQEGLGGAFFWEFSGDTADGELIKAISNNLQ